MVKAAAKATKPTALETKGNAKTSSVTFSNLVTFFSKQQAAGGDKVGKGGDNKGGRSGR